MLMIEHLAGFPDNVVAFVCKGRVTKADYDAVLIPTVLNTLKKHQKVRLYYETAPDFAGGGKATDPRRGPPHGGRVMPQFEF
jgi:hypothetical protein